MVKSSFLLKVKTFLVPTLDPAGNIRVVMLLGREVVDEDVAK